MAYLLLCSYGVFAWVIFFSVVLGVIVLLEWFIFSLE
jgi:hypothetical protein